MRGKIGYVCLLLILSANTVSAAVSQCRTPTTRTCLTSPSGGFGPYLLGVDLDAAAVEQEQKALRDKKAAIEKALKGDHLTETENKELGDDPTKIRGDDQTGKKESFDLRYFDISFAGITTIRNLFSDPFMIQGSSREYRELVKSNDRVFRTGVTLHFRRHVMLEQAEETMRLTDPARLAAYGQYQSWFQNVKKFAPAEPKHGGGRWDISYLNFELDLTTTLGGGSNRDELATGLAAQTEFSLSCALNPLSFDIKFHDSSEIPWPTTGLSLGPALFGWVGSGSDFVNVQYVWGIGSEAYFVIPGFYKQTITLNDGGKVQDRTLTRAGEARLGLYYTDFGVPNVERRFASKVGDPVSTAGTRNLVRVTQRGVVQYRRQNGLLISGSARLPLLPAASIIISGRVLIGSSVTSWEVQLGVSISIGELFNALGGK